MACVCQRPPSFLVDRRASRSSVLAICSRALESLCSDVHANLWIVRRVTRGYRVLRSRASFDCLSGATDFKLIVRARGLTHTLTNLYIMPQSDEEDSRAREGAQASPRTSSAGTQEGGSLTASRGLVSRLFGGLVSPRGGTASPESPRHDTGKTCEETENFLR